MVIVYSLAVCMLHLSSSSASINAMEKAKERIKQRTRTEKKRAEEKMKQVKSGDGTSPRKHRKKKQPKDAWGKSDVKHGESSSSGFSDSDSEWDTDVEEGKKTTIKNMNPYGLKRRRRKNLYKGTSDWLSG
jgi:type IV secretory pathway TrbL component